MPELAKKIRLLRAWGEEVRYEHKYRGFNYRMDGVQGAILGVKLRHLEPGPRRARRNAAEYGRRSGRDVRGGAARTPRCAPRVSPLRRSSPATAIPGETGCTEAGVQTGVHYPIPVHLQPAYRDLGYAAGDFPACEVASREVLSLPMFPELTDAQIAEVAHALSTRVGDQVSADRAYTFSSPAAPDSSAATWWIRCSRDGCARHGRSTTSIRSTTARSRNANIAAPSRRIRAGS